MLLASESGCLDRGYAPITGRWWRRSAPKLYDAVAPPAPSTYQQIRACPFNALYWDFYQRNAAKLKNNPRIGMAYRQLEKMPATEREAIHDHAQALRARLNDL